MLLVIWGIDCDHSKVLIGWAWVGDREAEVWKCYWRGMVKSLSRVRLFATPWTVAYQAPLSMGFSQAIVLEWIAISFSRESSWPRDRTQVSHIVDGRFTVWATRKSMWSPYDGGDPWMHSYGVWASSLRWVWRGIIGCYLLKDICLAAVGRMAGSGENGSILGIRRQQ